MSLENVRTLGVVHQESWKTYASIAIPDNELRQKASPFLEICLPYPTLDCLEGCLNAYKTAGFIDDAGYQEIESTFEGLIGVLTICNGLGGEGGYALSHPVAYGLLKLDQALSEDLALKPDLIRFYLTVAQSGLEANRQTANRYYDDLVNLRDVVSLCLQFLVMLNQEGAKIKETICGGYRVVRVLNKPVECAPDSVEPESTWLDPLISHAAIEKVESGLPKGLGWKLLESKLESVCELLGGNRQIGQPTYLRGSTVAIEKPDLEAISRRIHAIWEVNNPIKEGTSINSGLVGKDGETRVPYEEAVVQPGATQQEAEPVPEVTPNQQGQFTVLDHQKRLRSSSGANAAQALESFEDVHRLPETRIQRWLEVLYSMIPLWCVFVFIVWTVGISPKRLERMVVTGNVPLRSDVALNKESGVLVIHVHGVGAISHDENSGDYPENHIVKIQLPKAWVKVILHAKLEAPFMGLVKRINNLAQKEFRYEAGMVPTLARVQASSFIFERGQFDELERDYKRGAIKFSRVSNSSYRSLSNDSLNKLYRKCFALMQEEWHSGYLQLPESTFKRWACALIIEASYLDGQLGSVIYHHPLDLKPLVAAVLRVFNSQKRALYKSKVSVSIKRLLSIINIQQINYWLVFELSTVSRPVSNTTELVLMESGIWISDKASPQYRERKFVPMHTSGDRRQDKNGSSRLSLQIENARSNLQCLFQYCDELDVSVVGEEILKSATPPPTVLEWKGDSIVVHRLGRKQLRRALENYGLEGLFHFEDNVTRHIGSTLLAQLLPDKVVNAILGHKGPIEFFGTESSGSIDVLNDATAEINRLLDRLGIQPALFSMERILSGGTHRAV